MSQDQEFMRMLTKAHEQQLELQNLYAKLKDNRDEIFKLLDVRIKRSNATLKEVQRLSNYVEMGGGTISRNSIQKSLLEMATILSGLADDRLG